MPDIASFNDLSEIFDLISLLETEFLKGICLCELSDPLISRQRERSKAIRSFVIHEFNE